jgi:predicted deacetylase
MLFHLHVQHVLLSLGLLILIHAHHTIHDVNPSCSEKLQTITDELDNLKVKYNLSIIPFYNKKSNVKDDAAFCNQISSLCQLDTVELTLHGLYHQLDEDFDSQSKEQEKNEI